MINEKHLSLIIPCFNEAASLVELHSRLDDLCAKAKEQFGLTCEIIYVDDGSKDETFNTANSLKAKHADVQIIRFSRNFGKESALLAGLEHAQYGAVLFMDGDGQHSPELALQLIKHWTVDGYDVAYTFKKNRDDESATKKGFVKSFYKILNMGVRQEIPENAGDFRLLSPRAANALRSMPEKNRFFKGLSAWVGFKQIGVAYEPAQRIDGVTKWSFWNLFALSLEGITSFTVAPLRLAAMLGFAIACFSIITGLVIMVETLLYGKSVPGYPSVFVGMMFLGGIQLLMIGILGEYIGKILQEVKNRPNYIIMDHETKRASL